MAVAEDAAPWPEVSARVAIVHGNRMLGELLRRHCAEAWRSDVVGVAHEEDSGLAAIDAQRPDFAIVGHLTPAVDAPRVLTRLKSRAARPQVIIVVDQLTDYLAHRLAKAGCTTVVEESSGDLAQLEHAFAQARAGRAYLCPEYMTRLSRLRLASDAFPKLLSARQELVLACIARAMDDQEISLRLGLACSTVQRHRSDLLRKLGVHGTPRLIRYAREAGFDQVALPTKDPDSKAAPSAQNRIAS